MSHTRHRCAIFWMSALLLLNSAIATAGQSDHPFVVAGLTSNAADDKIPRQDHRFAIQVGAFVAQHDAEKEVSRIRVVVKDSFYRLEPTDGKGMWYRVYAGWYSTRKAATTAAAQLKQKGIVDTTIIRKMATDDRQGKLRPRPEPDSGMVEIEEPASANQTVHLTLLDAIGYGLANNREIAVVGYTPQQAQTDVDRAQAAYDPFVFAEASLRREPNLESSVTDIVTQDDGLAQAGIRKPLTTGGQVSAYVDTRYGDLNKAVFERRYNYIFGPTIELRQPLLKNIGGKKERTAIKVATYQKTISEEEFRRKVIEIAFDVASAYWQLVLFKDLTAIDQQNLEMAAEVYRREEVRVSRGISQPLDLERARSNFMTRRSVLLRSREGYRLAMDRLRLLVNTSSVNIDADVMVVPVETPRMTVVEVDEAQAIAKALANRPELIKARQEMMIKKADEALAANQGLPTLDAFGRYRMSGYGEDFNGAVDDVSPNDEDAWEVGLSFEWAMGNRAADALRHRTKLMRLQAHAQIARIEDDIKLEVKRVLNGILTAKGDIEAARIAKAAAEQVVEGELARFDIGQTSNLELLRAQDLLAANSRRFSRAIVDYTIAVYELRRVQGMLPDGVEMETGEKKS